MRWMLSPEEKVNNNVQCATGRRACELADAAMTLFCNVVILEDRNGSDECYCCIQSSFLASGGPGAQTSKLQRIISRRSILKPPSPWQRSVEPLLGTPTPASSLSYRNGNPTEE